MASHRSLSLMILRLACCGAAALLVPAATGQSASSNVYRPNRGFLCPLVRVKLRAVFTVRSNVTAIMFAPAVE